MALDMDMFLDAVTDSDAGRSLLSWTKRDPGQSKEVIIRQSNFASISHRQSRRAALPLYFEEPLWLSTCRLTQPFVSPSWYSRLSSP